MTQSHPLPEASREQPPTPDGPTVPQAVGTGTSRSVAGRPAIARPLVLLPTYNERESMPKVVARVREQAPQVDILIIDDASPDGTGALADELAAADPHVHVMHRTGKEGLGKAYLAGFRWGIERGYDALIEMDADGSHRPEHLPALLEAAGDADVVIGSRWIRGGSVENWPLHRKALSVGGNQYIRILLGMPVNDATAGYRVYRASALEAIGLDSVESHGYCFQTDLTWKAVRAGLTVVEVPIRFVERQEGSSKMSGDIVRESLVNITRWGLEHRAGQVRDLVAGRGGRWHQLSDESAHTH